MIAVEGNNSFWKMVLVKGISYLPPTRLHFVDFLMAKINLFSNNDIKLGCFVKIV